MKQSSLSKLSLILFLRCSEPLQLRCSVKQKFWHSLSAYFGLTCKTSIGQATCLISALLERINLEAYIAIIPYSSHQSVPVRFLYIFSFEMFLRKSACLAMLKNIRVVLFPLQLFSTSAAAAALSTPSIPSCQPPAFCHLCPVRRHFWIGKTVQAVYLRFLPFLFVMLTEKGRTKWFKVGRQAGRERARRAVIAT